MPSVLVQPSAHEKAADHDNLEGWGWGKNLLQKEYLQPIYNEKSRWSIVPKDLK